MALSDRGLIRVQAISGLLFGSFLVVHLTNTFGRARLLRQESLWTLGGGEVVEVKEPVSGKLDVKLNSCSVDERYVFLAEDTILPCLSVHQVVDLEKRFAEGQRGCRSFSRIQGALGQQSLNVSRGIARTLSHRIGFSWTDLGVASFTL